MIVQVTQSHIDRGCLRKGDACPVYLALKDAGVPVVHVTSTQWATDTLDFTKRSYWHELPEIAITFIEDFDGKKPVKPIEFEIEWHDMQL